MFVKERGRNSGEQSWVPSLFAFFWIVLAGFAGAYIFKIVADEDLLNKEIGELAAMGSEAVAAQGLSPEERRLIIDARRTQDRTIAELTSTVDELKRRVAELTERLNASGDAGRVQTPPTESAPVPPQAAAAPQEPVTEPAAETQEPATEPAAETQEPAEPKAQAAVVAPLPEEEEDTGTRAVITSPPAPDAEVPLITASPATPQTENPDDGDSDDEREASPESAQSQAEETQEEAPQPAQAAAAAESEASPVTYGAEGASPEKPKDDAAKALELAAVGDPGMKFGIELGTVDTQQGLRPKWRDLLTNHAALVAGLEARRIMAPDKKWRLIAGPFDNPTEATQACALFKKAELDCEATVFTGDAL